MTRDEAREEAIRQLDYAKRSIIAFVEVATPAEVVRLIKIVDELANELDKLRKPSEPTRVRPCAVCGRPALVWRCTNCIFAGRMPEGEIVILGSGPGYGK